MKVLVTNKDINTEEYEVWSYSRFLEEAENNINVDESLLIDVACVDEEDYEEWLGEVEGDGFGYVALDGENPPSWFTHDIMPTPSALDKNSLDDESVLELADTLAMMDVEEEEDEGEKIGKIITFGSAKGGSGKTFTSLITAVYYAKDHPKEKVALIDLDVEEPQVGIVIKERKTSLKKFYSSYLSGDESFEAMKRCKANNDNMPSNLDFYLSPRDDHPIDDIYFWNKCLYNLFTNYDMLIIDTGTTYMQMPAIANAYKMADKICLLTAASMASVFAVANQIMRLTGELKNTMYSKEDGLESKINLIVTNSYDDPVTTTIVNRLGEEAPIIAQFGNLSQKINEIQVLSRWSLFDDNEGFRQGMRDIYSV